MELSTFKYYTLFLILVLLIQNSLGDCTLSSNSLNKQYNITSWTGNWTFEGYEVGANSGDFYYLLSSADQSQCGIIRENVSGTKVWAKTYSNGQCSGITLNSDESLLYFSSAYTSYYALGEVNCTDGSLNKYTACSQIVLNGKINSQFYATNLTEDFIYAIGSISVPSNTVPYIRYKISNDTLQFVSGVPSAMDSLTDVIEFKVWNGDLLFHAYFSGGSTYELEFTNATQMSTDSTWFYNISCTSTCSSSNYAKSDYDQTNIHIAINIPSEGRALIMVLAVTDGSLAGSLKTTQNSQQLTLGSLYSNNSTTWISMYSSSTSYSELIKYDSASNNYTIYQQTGYSYILQYIDPNNNDSWFALAVTESVSNATQACMDNISGLSVSTTTSGLDDATSFILGSVGTVSYFNGPGDLPIDNTINSTASDLTYSFVEVVNTQTNTTNQTTTGTQTNEDDDGLSTGEIVGIAVGSVFGLILIVVIAFVIIYIYRKTNNKYEGREEVKPDAQTEQQVDKNMSSERPQIVDDNMI